MAPPELASLGSPPAHNKNYLSLLGQAQAGAPRQEGQGRRGPAGCAASRHERGRPEPPRQAGAQDRRPGQRRVPQVRDDQGGRSVAAGAAAWAAEPAPGGAGGGDCLGRGAGGRCGHGRGSGHTSGRVGRSTVARTDAGASTTTTRRRWRRWRQGQKEEEQAVGEVLKDRSDCGRGEWTPFAWVSFKRTTLGTHTNIS